MCSTCYTLKRQDAEHFGGLREVVLERDGYRCRVCDASGRGKREIIVHHRVPGKSVLNLMISLCPGCHARIHRTKAALSIMSPLLLELWREQNPSAQEQIAFDFSVKKTPARRVPLFADLNKEPKQESHQRGNHNAHPDRQAQTEFLPGFVEGLIDRQWLSTLGHLHG